MSNLESDEKQIIKIYAFSIKTDCAMLVEGSGTDMSCFDKIFFFNLQEKLVILLEVLYLKAVIFLMGERNWRLET